MNAIIIEDEKLIAEELIHTLRTVEPDITVIQVLPSIKTAKNYFMQHAVPDLLFMDIRLGDGLSFEILESFTLDCPIIFTTAYEEYAIQAFRANGIDYLLKPVQEDELQRAINKIKKMKGDIAPPIDLQQLATYFMTGNAARLPFKERFVIHAHSKWVPIETSDIAVFYKDQLNYLYTFNGEKHIYDNVPIEEIEDVLDPKLYFRANRQTLIHIKSIQEVKPYGNQKLMVLLKAPLKMEIDISREKAPVFKKWVDQ
jgi:DNA-binding LytR/AlgR family response regulator